MKELFLLTFLIIFSFNSLYSQWYTKKYNVSDINFLSKEQLEESLKNSKRDLLLSGSVAGIGGIVFLLSKFADPVQDEDATFFQQLIGVEGQKKIGMGAGIGLIAGGTISSIVLFGRIGSIKSALYHNYPALGFLDISPALIIENRTRSYYPGISLSYHF